jgi:hypothetical protein
MTKISSPVLRNAHIVAYLLIGAYGNDDGELADYHAVASWVENEIRGHKLAGVAPAQDEVISHLIMDITSTLIRAGLLECNTFDPKRGRISYGNSTTIGVSEHVDSLLEWEPLVPVDPSEPYYYYGSPEVDALVDRMGPISFFVLNDPVSSDSVCFDLSGDISAKNLEAAVELRNLFISSAEVRRGIVNALFNEGSVYLEQSDADLGFTDHDNALS